jgi:hypothetical protein
MILKNVTEEMRQVAVSGVRSEAVCTPPTTGNILFGGFDRASL